MAIPPINVDVATFVEERLQNTAIYERLSSVCASISAIPHADVGQPFTNYVEQFFPNQEDALQDGHEIFRMLNDDGNGVSNAKNMAVGYKLHRLADIFKKIIKLPKDKIDVPENVAVDQPERFNTRFYDAQFRFPEAPAKNGNHPLDFIKSLHYVDAVLNSILLGLKHPLMINADVVYSDRTKEDWLDLKNQSEKLIEEIVSVVRKAGKIIGKYKLDDDLIKFLDNPESPLDSPEPLNDVAKDQNIPLPRVRVRDQFITRIEKMHEEIHRLENGE